MLFDEEYVRKTIEKFQENIYRAKARAELCEKPYRCLLNQWELREDTTRPEDIYLTGHFMEHPHFGSCSGYTSNLVEIEFDDGWVETLNSVYALGDRWKSFDHQGG